ncbi:hypothetical protein BJX64DRAFT_286109 [Aspergillus heterothallicus]
MPINLRRPTTFKSPVPALPANGPCWQSSSTSAEFSTERHNMKRLNPPLLGLLRHHCVFDSATCVKITFSMASNARAESHSENNEYFYSPSGTRILFDDAPKHGVISDRLHELKHRTKGDSRILLVPQPSVNDPNDPLRWPAWKKNLTFFNACWYGFYRSHT